MSKKNPKYDEWLYCHPDCENAFAMVTADLLESKQFMSLSYAARFFYIILAAHKKTTSQRQCLYMTLKDYHRIQNDGKSDLDIQFEAGTLKRQKKDSPFFVIPEKQLREYGLTGSYATKLKNELIEKGFISEVFFTKDKNGYSNYNSKTPTLYRFSSKWKE